jgi:hypothetical protein
MMPPPASQPPSEYWNACEARKSQRLYISFCELAAATLDYAEGLSLLRRDERRQGAARLNWAGTAFYYSLVHSARFLIFTAIGDFPTQHGQLPRAFSTEPAGTFSTSWLKSFAPTQAGQYTAKSHSEQLVEFWSMGTAKKQIEAQFEWLADALVKAKALREENNYQALLIAHEYNHSYLNSSFKDLATAMDGVARVALDTAVRSYARLLQPEASSGLAANVCGETAIDNNSLWRDTEAAFVHRYVQRRIIEPVWNWYGTDAYVVGNAISALMEPLSALHVSAGIELTPVEKSVSVGMFKTKVGLMDKFKGKISELQHVLNDAPTPHVNAQ